MRLSTVGLQSLVALVVALVTGCVGSISNPVPSPTATPRAGDPNPANPLVFPSPRPSVTLTPATACTGETLTLQATSVPANAVIEIWVKGLTAGGWKVGNPPHPSEAGALKLGSAMADASGVLRFAITFTETIAARFEPTAQTYYEIWLLYPSVDGKTAILPTAATFRRSCGP